VKLFQIEEPDGSPGDPDAPGAAVGIDASGALAEVAVSVGGNAVMLADREGFELSLPVPAADGDWQDLLTGTRLRAERALARPVTHAVIALASAPNADLVQRLRQSAEAVGMLMLRIVPVSELARGEPPALAVAVIAEDLAPRPETA
jgi:hypothetical protein